MLVQGKAMEVDVWFVRVHGGPKGGVAAFASELIAHNGWETKEQVGGSNGCGQA